MKDKLKKNIGVMRVKVRVKVFTDWGKTCLREIRGLEEGSVKVGSYCKERNKVAVDIKHNGESAVLWLGENCEFVKKSMNKQFQP